MKRTLKGAIEYWEHIELNFWDWGYEYGVTVYDKYIQHLKQHLQLWMFIPCDKDGKPLEKPDKPIWSDLDYEDCAYYENWIKEYQQACDRVLFDGNWTFCDEQFSNEIWLINLNTRTQVQIKGKTAESLSGKVELTEKIANNFKY